MMHMTTGFEEVLLLRLQSGEDILKSLQQYVEVKRVRNALVISGFGSVSHYHFHVVADSSLPPAEAYPRGEKALDIVAMSGAILNGRVHAHIVFTDDQSAKGGHLEEGCRVLTFAVVALGVLAGDADLSAWDDYNTRS